jgi:hypothetical protein
MKIKEQEITNEDILDHWGLGKTSLDWRPLTIKGKREWLKACLSWTGLPRKRIPSFNYIIDGNQVTTDLDFYCLLGETFFGYRGYFGQDSHGFNDCFSEISIHEGTKQTVGQGANVVIKNSKQLMEILTEDIFAEIIKVLSGHGFTIDVE